MNAIDYRTDEIISICEKGFQLLLKFCIESALFVNSTDEKIFRIAITTRKETKDKFSAITFVSFVPAGDSTLF